MFLQHPIFHQTQPPLLPLENLPQLPTETAPVSLLAPRWPDKRGALVSSQRTPNPKPTPQPDPAGTHRHVPTGTTALPSLTAAHTHLICTAEPKTFHWNLYFKQSYF